MKAKLLFIFMLLFTISFFGQGFSGFRIHNAGTTEIIKTTTSVTTKTDSIASKNGNPAEKIITTETVTSSLKKEVPVVYSDETFVPFPWNSDKVTNVFNILYGEANFLNQAGVTFGNNSGAIYTEIAGGRFLRNFRLSLGAMVSSTSGGTQEQERAADAYQRLVSYGGNTVLNIEYPWLYKYSKDWNVHVLSRFFFKGTADIPALGTTTEDWAGSGSLGVNFYADAATINIDSTKPGEEIKLFFDGNFSYIVGTDVYKENLGIKNNNFTFAQLTAGFVYKSLKISIIFVTLSSESALRKNKAVIGVQGIK